MKKKPVPRKGQKNGYVEYPDGRIVIDENTRAGQDRKNATIAQAWAEQEGICPICGKYVCLLEATWDHIIPRRMGAGFRDDRRKNIRAVHYVCNGERGSQPVDFSLVP
jgi:hypothetical protein